MWHHCEDEHGYVSHKDPKQKYFENGDCSICDFQLFPADIHHFPVFTFQKTTHLQFDSFAKGQYILEVTDTKNDEQKITKSFTIN